MIFAHTQHESFGVVRIRPAAANRGGDAAQHDARAHGYTQKTTSQFGYTLESRMGAHAAAVARAAPRTSRGVMRARWLNVSTGNASE